MIHALFIAFGAVLGIALAIMVLPSLPHIIRFMFWIALDSLILVATLIFVAVVLAH